MNVIEYKIIFCNHRFKLCIIISLKSKFLLLEESPTVLSLFPDPSLVAVLTLSEDDIDFPNPPLSEPLVVSFVKVCNAKMKHE